MADVDIADVTTGTVDSGDDLLGVGRPANVARLFSVASIITLAQTFASPLIAPSGSASAPSYSFSGDTNTGIYASAADTIALATGGTQRATLSAAAFTSTVPFVAALGEAFKIDNGRYFGTDAGDDVFMTANGRWWVVRNSGTGNSAHAASDMSIGWSSSTSAPNEHPDTALIRQAAGIIALTNGSTGGAAMLYREQSAPTGVTDAAIVYADVSGAKTRLMCIFQTGAAQQLAIEP